MTGPIKKVAMQRQLDALAFSVLANTATSAGPAPAKD